MLPGGGVVSIAKPSVLIGRETCMLATRRTRGNYPESLWNVNYCCCCGD
ncbi:unnamed protein product [Ectocarpus sp. 4 AP-2014]